MDFFNIPSSLNPHFSITFFDAGLNVNTYPVILLSLNFLYNYTEITIILNLALFIGLVAYFYLKDKYKNNKNTFAIIYILLFGICTMCVGLTYSLSTKQQGQMNQYLKWGRNKESKKIISFFKNTDTIWINNIGWDQLPSFYRKNTVYEPEMYWKLASWIPKKHMLKIKGIQNTYDFSWKNIYELKNQVKNNSIDKLALIKSTISSESFPMQKNLLDLKKQNWLIHEKTIRLKNKNLYIFKVLQ